MKGRKGGEGPQVGVVPDTSPPPSTGGARVMAAAKRRKRGGRVPVAKADKGPPVEGKEAPKRLDKPQRARGGSVDKQKYGGSGLEEAGAATLKSIESKMRDADKPKGDVGRGMAAGKNIGEAALKSPLAAKYKNRAMRARGGKVGADTKPFTHAKTTKATKGHSTEANIT